MNDEELDDPDYHNFVWDRHSCIECGDNVFSKETCDSEDCPCEKQLP